MLSDVPPRALAELCREHGRDHVLEPGRCRALLADTCGAYRREVFLLDCVARERLIQPALAVGMPVEFAVSQLANQIVQELCIASDSARWAAEAWAVAMEWTSEGSVPGAPGVPADENTSGGTSEARHPQRLLVEGILRAFRGGLGDVGIGTYADKPLIEAVSGGRNDAAKGSDTNDAWATVRFLTFTRQPRGLVFTDHAVHFLNPAAADGQKSGSWSFARLQEVRARRQGLQEICLAAADDRMSLEATGIASSTMLLFLDLIREVVGPFLVDHDLAEPSPPPTEMPTPKRRAKR